MIATELAELVTLYFRLAVALASATAAYAQTPTRLVVRIAALDSATGAPISGDVLVQQVVSGATLARGVVRDGRARIIVPSTDSSFLLTIRGIGFVRYRAELDRRQLVTLPPVLLRRSTGQLARVTVVSRRQGPPPSYEFDPQPLVTGGVLPSVSSIAPGERGDIASQLATAAGVVLVNQGDGAAGVSAFGAATSQNAVTLGGMPVAATTVPRTAPLISRIETSTYDVANTGFGGVQFATSLVQGGTLPIGSILISLNPPDGGLPGAAGRAVNGAQLGAGVSGPLPGRYQYFSVHGQVSQSVVGRDRWRDRINPGVLSGIEPWLLRRNIPAAGGDSPARTSAAVVARLDRARPGGWTLSLQSLANLTRLDGLVTGANRLPSTAQDLSFNAFATVADIAGPVGSWLSRSKIAVNHQAWTSAASTSYPAVSLRLPVDGSTEVGLLAGGGQGGEVRAQTASVHLQQAFERFAGQRGEHRLKVVGELYSGTSSQETAFDRAGLYTLRTSSDTSGLFAASYQRNLGTTTSRLPILKWAAGVGDAWQPTARMRIEGGIRVDGTMIPRSGAGAAPSLFPVSGAILTGPRLGAEWALGRREARIGDLSGGARATLRVGVARLVATPGAEAWTPLAQVASPDAATVLCTGSSIPSPPWGTVGVTPGGECVTTPSTEGMPRWEGRPIAGTADRLLSGVTWWGGPFSTAVAMNVALSRHSGERVTRDANLRAEPVWRNAEEGDRAMYAGPEAWDPASSRVPLLASRADVTQGWIWRSSAAGVSEAAVWSLSISPRKVGAGLPNWFVQYSLGRGRERRGGWDASTAGDPRNFDWMPSSTLPRHAVVGFLQLPIASWATLSANLVTTSGAGFTPVVLGDVNGDGASNDRVSTAVWRALPPASTAALTRQWPCLSSRGPFFSPNGCANGWTARSSATLVLDGRVVGLPARSTVTVVASNIQTAVAPAVFGSRADRILTVGPRNPFLLVPTGFDPATQRFRYRVNEDFGRSLVGPTEFSAPFSLGVEVRLPAFGGPLTQLQRRVAAGASPTTLRQLWATSASPSLAQMVAVYADSLLLTPAQRAATDGAIRAYRAERDSLFSMAARAPGGIVVKTLNEALWDAASRVSRSLESVLTPDQWALFAPIIQGLVSEAAMVRARREGGLAPP